MGRRVSSKKLVKNELLYCCFCGGTVRATTVDHVPSVQFFDQKDASFTLRVPSCAACNSRTATSEQVIAFLARVLRNGADPTDIKSIFKGFCEANAQLSRRILPTANMKREAKRTFGTASVLRLDDDELQSHVQIVGAKWAFALHSKKFGSPITDGGGVWVKWWSNADRVRGPILPPNLDSILPQIPEILKIGSKKSSIGQFEYVFRALDDNKYEAGLFFVTCSNSFAMLLITSQDDSLFEEIEKEGALIHRPTCPLEPVVPLQLGPFYIESYQFERRNAVSLSNA